MEIDKRSLGFIGDFIIDVMKQGSKTVDGKNIITQLDENKNYF